MSLMWLFFFLLYLYYTCEELDVKDTSDTQNSAFYLDLHLEIANRGRLKTKLQQTQWLHFPVISSNIPASSAYGVWVCISQLVSYSRACAQYSDFLDRAQLLTQKLLKQGYVVPRLKSSLQKFYYRHRNLVDRYEIFISQMGLLLFT